MLGLMMDRPMLVSSLLTFAARYHGDTEIVTQTVEGPIHRYTYRDAESRSRRVAKLLGTLGIGMGDRIGTLAWNTHRHLELYYGVSGCGAVCHTVNPRLFEDQLVYIVNHAQDRIVFFDLSFAPLVAKLQPRCPGVEHWVALAATVPAETPFAKAYEALLDSVDDVYTWPEFDENTASSLCYTSGTTGNPKGVLYSHRSTVLHGYAFALPDAGNLSAKDTVLPVVPMFHANAWSLPYSVPLVGAKLVLPGPRLDGASLVKLFADEKVTLAAGVPTVWQMLLAELHTTGAKLPHFKRTAIGGSACPPAMIRAFHDIGVDVVHAWGMTETSPVGTICTEKAKHTELSTEARLALKGKQGRPLFGVDLEILDDDGKPLPHDGVAFGNLVIKGYWVVDRYLGQEHTALRDGWFHTGDVATIDPDGYMQITDRSKDVIKSGGEWISSVDLENVAMGCPGVAMAAAIGIAHPKWDERPLLVVQRKPDATLTREDVLAFLDGKIAKWWTPDDVVFVDAIPLTATGKMWKLKLRESFRDYRLPGA